MNNLNFIFNRQSVRQYTGQKVEDEKMDQLLHVAMAAPSARKKDPWRFIVLQDGEKLAKLQEILPNGPFLTEAANAIVVLGDLNEAWDNSLIYMIQDCSAAVQNIMLAAAKLELGSCWLGVQPKEERIKGVSEFFNLPKNIIPIAVIALGYPACETIFKSRYNNNFVHYNRW
ncbi:nitroreductase family protein [Lentisphaerota bacterium WC36G]|nr:nitroreductase family protein [Lentisphaerae bacterium WC36]